MSNPVIYQDPKYKPSTTEISKPRRRSIIREFALNTSTHGLPGIARSESKHNCLFWTISFLMFGGVMIYFVVQSIKDYFEYPTQTSISIVIERSQTFPAVTLCNYAMGRFDRIIEPFLNYTNSRNLTNTNDTSMEGFTINDVLLLQEFFQEQLNTHEPIANYLFSLNSMLLSCSYNGEKCGVDDFISFLSSTYGLCYTFNAKKYNMSASNIRSTNDYGGPGRLELRLYANSHLYVPYTTQDVSAGMVAMIHDNTQLPLIDIAGINLVPGRRHKLSYKKKAAYFLPLPYTDCTNEIPSVMQAMFKQYEGADYAYSQGVCYTLCTQTYVYQECGCVNPAEWTARYIGDRTTKEIVEAPLCKSANTCYMNATIRLTSTIALWDDFCADCKQACRIIDFTVTPSAVSALSSESLMATKLLVESLPIPLPTNWSTNWPSEIQNNYVALDVVCESTQVENYTQQASISAVDVLSNVGGHSGLWIGISFLSIMEFIEMLYRLLRYECRVANWWLADFDRSQHYTNGYRITTRFLAWCENRWPDIITQLNAALRSNTYSDNSWYQFAGERSIDQLWSDYAENANL